MFHHNDSKLLFQCKKILPPDLKTAVAFLTSIEH